MMKLVILVSALFFASFSLGSQLLDLGYGFDGDTIAFPGGRAFGYLKQFASEDGNGVWYSANDLATAEHCGTHLDAPYHFSKTGRKVGEIPLEKLITKAILINATDETQNNYQYKMPASKLLDWEKENGPIPNNSVVLVSTGWAYKYPNRTEYLGPSDDDLRFPGISLEAAQWIVNSKKIVGVGIDTPSIDQSMNTDAHIELNGNDIYILENVALNQVLPPTFDIIVMPMKLTNGTGAPCRIVAVI